MRGGLEMPNRAVSGPRDRGTRDCDTDIQHTVRRMKMQPPTMRNGGGMRFSFFPKNER